MPGRTKRNRGEVIEFGLKIPADSGENSLQGIIMRFPENLLPIFGDEDQMNVKIEYAMPAMPDFS